MQDNDEYDEDGFPVLKFSDEEIAEARARMDQVIDCRALATAMLADRPVPSKQVLDALARELGIDGTKTLTEIEGTDLGDAHDVADEAEVHALRYVPVGRWLARDVRLMLAYGHGEDIGLALAERHLSNGPMIETEFYAGDLLETFGRHARTDAHRAALDGFLDRAKAEAWQLFGDIANQAGLDDTMRTAARRRLSDGERAPPGRNPFLEIEHALDQIARIEDGARAPIVLARASAKQLFAVYRPRKSLEIVPLPDIEDPDYRASIADPGTFKFRRDTTFTIITDRDGDGVRLLIFSESAADHALGRRFADEASARTVALRDYGVADTDWAAG